MLAILLFDIAVFLLLTNRISLTGLFCIVIISMVQIVCEKPKMASQKCEKEHNQLSVKIDFMANCKKKGMTDYDSQNADEHNCYMMRRYCAKECSENGYDGGSCDVKSLFTLNLNVDSRGNYETLDCVCIYNTPKIGCYSTHHVPWKTVTKEFEEKCALKDEAKTTTTTKALTKRSPKILVIGGQSNSGVETRHSLEYYFPDQPENNIEVSAKLGFPGCCSASFLLQNDTVLIVNRLGWEIFDPALSIVSTSKYWSTKRKMSEGYALLADILYMCGGCRLVDSLSLCQRYQKGRWNADVQGMIESRCFFPMVVLDNYMYAIGGLHKVSPAETEILNDVERYDPDSNSWKIMPQMTTKRKGHGAAGFNGMLYACGGLTHDGKVSTCEYHKLGTNKWRPIGSMKMTRVGFSLVVLTNRLFAVGPDGVEEYKDKKWSIKKKKLIKSRNDSTAVAVP